LTNSKGSRNHYLNYGITILKRLGDRTFTNDGRSAKINAF